MSDQTSPPAVRETVAFTHTLLSRRYATEGTSLEGLVEDRHLRLFLEADLLAANGSIDSALAIADSLINRELAIASDPAIVVNRFPIFRSILYLLRSDWLGTAGETLSAIESLRWHENTDIVDLPTGKPMTYEVDWALGTMASWKRAGLLDQEGRLDRELCRLYNNVADVWKTGDSPYLERAVFARNRWNELTCESLSANPP